MSNLLLDLASAVAAGNIRIVDLTQPLGPSTPVIDLPPPFGQSSPFKREAISHFDDKGPAWYWNNFTCGEHTGTHFDTPSHWISGKDHADGYTDTIAPQRFMAPAGVIDCSKEAAANEDFLLTRPFVEAWEAKNGRIPKGCWVLMRTDWSKRTDAKAFLNCREDGAHVPGPDVEVMKFLAQERDIHGWGVESVGTDYGQAHTFDPPFPAHFFMHGANKFGLASLCNLDQLPIKGAVIVAAPLKIEKGSASPVRVLALVAG